MAKSTLTVFLFVAIVLLAGCGSNSTSGNPQTPGAPIDPSGNWTMSFTDANNNAIFMSALFNQVGSTVTAFNILALNSAPFSCVPFQGSFANGTVQNVDQFSGDLFDPRLGTLHFSSTLNPQGTHSDGTYTLTAGSKPGCAGVAATGTFSADEIPSMTGTWTGTINCNTNCPAGSTTGTISATLTQDDSNDAVTGNYTVTGLPTFTSGTLQGDQFSELSGHSWQDNMTDNDGAAFVIAGGPSGGPGSPGGLELDRSFTGIIVAGTTNARYSVVMSH